jgi:DNA-binding LacI/PurR family transcriptional regulator
LVDARISIEDDLIVNGDFSIDGGFDAGLELFSMTMPPTAIFAMSDEMAVGAIRAAREANLRIPEDVAIVGFDDHDFAAPIGLTTVRQPVVEQGAMAAQALLDAVGGDPWGADQVLDHVFVPRETTPAL